jgi:hypothetical protein
MALLLTRFSHAAKGVLPGFPLTRGDNEEFTIGDLRFTIDRLEPEPP